MADDDAAVRLLEEALHLRMHGERAPGGNETWREWHRKTEAFLRARLVPVHYHWPVACGDHSPGDLWTGNLDRVTCPACRA